MHRAGPFSRAGPMDGVCIQAWLLIIAVLCLLLHFASLSHTCLKGRWCWCKKKKAAKLESLNHKAARHTLSQRSVSLGQWLNQLQTLAVYSLAQRGGADPGLGTALLMASACLPVWAALVWEPVGAGLWGSKWNKTFHLNLPLLMSHCPQLLLLLLFCRNVFSRFKLSLNQSQDHRMVKAGRRLCSSKPLLKQLHLQELAQDHIWMGFKYLQRKRLHSLSGQPVPVLCHPQRTEAFPHSQMELPAFQSVPVAPCPVAEHHCKEPVPM